MKVIKFDKDYKKLENYDFTTIRDHNKEIFLEEIVLIKTPTKSFKAEVTGLAKLPLKDIGCDLIAKDLDLEEEWLNGTVMFEDLLESLQEIYHGLTWDSVVFAYSFMRIQEEDY